MSRLWPVSCLRARTPLTVLAGAGAGAVAGLIDEAAQATARVPAPCARPTRLSDPPGNRHPVRRAQQAPHHLTARRSRTVLTDRPPTTRA